MVDRRRLSGVSHWRDGVKPASKGIRRAIFVLDAILIIIGIILIWLGIYLNDYIIVTSSRTTELPPIWAVGLLPIILGVVGVLCSLFHDKKWIVAWIVLCILAGAGAFVTFVLLNFFDLQTYGINVQVFGDCEDDGSNCKCLWEGNRSVVGLLRSPCEVVRTASGLYLTLVFVFILCVALLAIAVILGCVLSFCLRYCAPMDPRMLALHSTIYGANVRTMQPFIPPPPPSTASELRTALQETVFGSRTYLRESPDPEITPPSAEDSDQRSDHYLDALDDLDMIAATDSNLNRFLDKNIDTLNGAEGVEMKDLSTQT